MPGLFNRDSSPTGRCQNGQRGRPARHRKARSLLFVGVQVEELAACGSAGGFLIKRYLLALVFTAIGSAGHLLMSSGPEGDPFLTFYIPITLCAMIVGTGPALLTAVLSTLIAWFFFIPPVFSFALTRT